ncbi:hypothetical protein PVL29_021406 [Vitis rotundifolia]|uniref:F-box domain-containing protein n=1 Tax=Vitis rotundifolia TaxID=103349 RepID=A0AA39DEP1_VITRO|nr:hypothetical protein PVL29_021406 [Vitis rotundifolia]
MASVSGWGQLPDRILHSILEYMVPTDERVKFSAVCSRWRRAAREHCREHTSTPPLLLFPTPDNSGRRRSLYNVTRKTLCQSQLWDEEDSEEEYSESDEEDWKEGEEEEEIIDSEEREAFERRKRETVTDFSIQKGVLFMDPERNPNDYVLMVVYGSKESLAFIK